MGTYLNDKIYLRGNGGAVLAFDTEDVLEAC